MAEHCLLISWGKAARNWSSDPDSAVLPPDDLFGILETIPRNSRPMLERDFKNGADRGRNDKRKNPIARIRPIPIFIQGHGAQEPDPAYFPKYADQFYGLRKPQKERNY
ncbi:hypothetical protein B0T25DRAFT_563327 [Lasiosphaeria hispida]|uniref:Uncharacterized protein n=1 Tax=Lasiosphaeria hispida TaxID=260671 RepID=A0AAJ0HXC2_9PEZI|nr:hypothetical protein B0T25DRAFT_563327 [Lasiosphaeria hispida]